MTMMMMLMPSVGWLLWLSCLAPATAAAGVDHGRALKEWLKRTNGGFFHDNLDIRRLGDANSTSFGMFAIKPIPEDDVLLRIPRSMLVTPIQEYRVGDNVSYYDEEEDEDYYGLIHEIHSDGTFMLIFADGDRVDHATTDSIQPASWMCKTTERLVEEMKLGDSSKLAPYVNYLLSQPQGQLPSAWSETGRDLFLEIAGYTLKEGQVLPPFDPFQHTKNYREDCANRDGEFGENAYMLLFQRGWDDLMIPVFDMMSHGNGKWLNTKITGSVHDEDSPVTVEASRRIEIGEEIYTTYNFCEDCENRKLFYGTPELLRDYGFVEQYPQRWVFEDQETIFDLNEVNGKLTLEFVANFELGPKHAAFFSEQLQRLEDLGETVFAVKDPGVSEYEWNNLVRFRESLITAIRMLLAVSGHGDVCTNDTCMITSSRFDDLSEGSDPDYWGSSRPMTCHDYRWAGVAFWEYMEVIETPYQKITYIDNPTFDPPDTCFMLESTWQICTSYRPHYHEMNVHFAARFLDEVKRALFVGGGDSMLLHNILQYPTLEKVIGLEIDQVVTRSAFKYFGVSPHFDNDKVEWWFGDASKSMLVLPKEHYGSFDLVVVDLSETVAALSVTSELDVMEALSLLIKPDGILVKNEYEYFQSQRQIFRDAIHIHYYNTPVVCSQSLVLGSNGVDFLRGPFKDHGVKTLYHLMDEPDVRYSIARDYQKNHTNPQDYCSHEKQQEPTEQKESVGITMIVEAEQATADLKSSKAVKDIVETALTKQGFSVVSTVLSENAELPVAVTVLREGYVAARSWPEHNYCAYDIHLWGSLEKHDAAKKALIEAVGSSIDGPASSSYRIVSGGMFGVSTWKEDEANRGPKLAECNATSSSSKAKSSPTEADESLVLAAIEESSSLIPDEDDFIVAVICGKEDKPCPSVGAMKKASRVADVIVLHGCADLPSDVGFSKNAAASVLTCEKTTWKLLQSNLQDGKKKIRAIVVDSSAERAFVSAVLSLVKSPINKKRFLDENITVVAPVKRGELWRKHFVAAFQEKIFPLDPAFKSEVYFNSTSNDESFVLSIASSGDILFFKQLVHFVEQVEKKASVAGEINGVRGGDFDYQDPFEIKQKFDDSDFDQGQAAQWESQKPLALQALFQLKVRDKAKDVALSTKKIKTTLQIVLESSQIRKVVIEEVTEVGDGCVLVAIWSQGHVVVLWDGRDHVDINLFTYEEDFEFADQFEESFTDHLPSLERALRDIHPRGINRVINFAKDMDVEPRWVGVHKKTALSQ